MRPDRNLARAAAVYSTMDSLRLDVRCTLRTLLHRPGFASLAMVTLTIGIGVNTVAFSAVNALAQRCSWLSRCCSFAASGPRRQWILDSTHPACW